MKTGTETEKQEGNRWVDGEWRWRLNARGRGQNKVFLSIFTATLALCDRHPSATQSHSSLARCVGFFFKYSEKLYFFVNAPLRFCFLFSLLPFYISYLIEYMSKLDMDLMVIYFLKKSLAIKL